MDDAAKRAERVCHAVAGKISLPDKTLKLDKPYAAIGAGIEDAIQRYEYALEFGRDTRWRARAAYCGRVAKAARKLSDLLDDKKHAEWFASRIRVAYMRRGAPVHESIRTDIEGKATEVVIKAPPLDPTATLTRFRADLERLVELAPLKHPGNPTGTLFRSEFSPFDRLVGKWLPKVYQVHFERKASVSKVGDQASGPYIAFVQATLKEYAIVTSTGREYSPESIAAALKSCRRSASTRAVTTRRK